MGCSQSKRSAKVMPRSRRAQFVATEETIEATRAGKPLEDLSLQEYWELDGNVP